MKKSVLFITMILFGCQYEIVNDYRLEKYHNSEVPVCVNYAKRVKIIENAYSELDMCGNTKHTPAKYKETDRFCDIFEPQVVSYNYCLSNLQKPVHLVEKKVGDMTICYDRNNKVELPILYCQKDMINIQTTEVHTNVLQQTKVNNKTMINW